MPTITARFVPPMRTHVELPLRRIAREVNDFRQPLTQSVTEVGVPGFVKRFATQPWPPHAPFTIAKWGPHPILSLTGTSKGFATSAGQWNITQTQAIFGDQWPESQWFMRLHQGGGTRWNFPVREWSRWEPGDDVKVGTIFEVWLEELIARHW